MDKYDELKGQLLKDALLKDKSIKAKLIKCIRNDIEYYKTKNSEFKHFTGCIFTDDEEGKKCFFDNQCLYIDGTENKKCRVEIYRCDKNTKLLERSTIERSTNVSPLAKDPTVVNENLAKDPIVVNENFTESSRENITVSSLENIKDDSSVTATIGSPDYYSDVFQPENLNDFKKQLKTLWQNTTNDYKVVITAPDGKRSFTVNNLGINYYYVTYLIYYTNSERDYKMLSFSLPFEYLHTENENDTCPDRVVLPERVDSKYDANYISAKVTDNTSSTFDFNGDIDEFYKLLTECTLTLKVVKKRTGIQIVSKFLNNIKKPWGGKRNTHRGKRNTRRGKRNTHRGNKKVYKKHYTRKRKLS